MSGRESRIPLRASIRSVPGTVRTPRLLVGGRSVQPSEDRMDDKLCLLVIIGTTEKGVKELVAVEDGYRESEASWHEILSGLRCNKF